MNYIKIILYFLTIALAFTGCQGIPKANQGHIVAPPTNSSPPIGGTWVFEEHKSLRETQENGSQDHGGQQLTGQFAYFDQEWAEIAGDSCVDAQYRIRRVDAKDYFLLYYNVRAEELGIQELIVDIVSITSSGVLFFDVIMLDDKTAMVSMDRSLYRLKKVSEEVAKAKEEPEKQWVFPKEGKDGKDELLRSGVFLGLRRTIPSSDGEDRFDERPVYRTIWISSHNRKIKSALEAPDLFIPRRSGFWTLSLRTGKTDGIFRDFIELKGIDAGDIHNSDILREDSGVRVHTKKDILFVGDDYLGMEYFEVPEKGGEVVRGYRVLPLDDANGDKGIKVSDIADVGMEDIFHKSAKSHLVSRGMKVEDSKVESMEEDNFTLWRRNCHWTLRGRINIGNETEDFPIGLMPVGRLLNYDDLHVSWDLVKERIPTALDAYTSPNRDLLIVVTGNFLIVYTLEEGRIADKPIRKIGLKKGESVIMAEWATGNYVARWEEGFSRLTPYIIYE